MSILSEIIIAIPIIMLIVFGLIISCSSTANRHDQSTPLPEEDNKRLRERSIQVGMLALSVLKYFGTKYQDTDEHGHTYEYLEYEDDNFHIGRSYLSITTTGEYVFDIKAGKIIQDGPWVEKFLSTYSKI
ncbi:hypothetical protein IJH19_00315 [Candidatus Saccharibacteria bacterium]|nr:hypothetical protein [Candidatus Saccharibacteria bacterium]